ncbi:MAG TPA: hypothetical protein VFU94_01220 [Conexibacter sp.]|nr:hypothetical protein [Conexibacter sp.]
MSTLALGLALALLASVALNGSYLLQHAGGRDAPAVDVRRPLRTLRGLLRSRLWSAGLVAGLLGWALHVGALSRAPLSLVQAFAVGGLALAVPVGARVLREPLAAGELAAIAAMVAALALLALGADAGPAPAGVPAIALGACLGGCALIAGALACRPAPGLLGTAAGVLYGAADVATKAATIAVTRHGLAAALLSPWPLAVVLLSCGAFFCFQRGLQTGAAVPVVALMTAATNAVAVLGGLIVLGERLGATPALAAVHALALVALGLAAWRLAPSQARIAAGAEPPVPVPAAALAPRPA